MALMPELGASPELMTRTPGFGNWEFPSSWSPDGAWLAFVARRGAKGADILLMSLPDRGEPVPLVETAATELAPTFSPDGRWLAYVSDDTGRREVYVRPFPGRGGRTPVSSHGGTEPLWARDGRELFFRQGDRIMAARVDGSGERFAAHEPEVLLPDVRLERFSGFGASYAHYDVSPDGTRFVFARRKNPVTATVINVVLNWPQTLRGSSEAER